MSTGALDPQIHHPGRLRVVATLAVLPDGDAMSVPRLQTMTGLSPGRLTSHLRELDHAGYVRTAQAGRGSAPATVALTRDGRAALDRYTTMLRPLPRWPGKIIRHQNPTCAWAMLTGMRPPQP